jgi:hypothetical protein
MRYQHDAIHAKKGLLQGSPDYLESTDVLDLLTLLGSVRPGFFWHDSYASFMKYDVSQKPTFKKVVVQVAKRMLSAHWCRVRFQPRSLVSQLGTLVTRRVLVADAAFEKPQFD